VGRRAPGGRHHQGFAKTDARFLEVAEQRGLQDGSTACVLLLHGTEPSAAKLFCANVGDCRAVLCRGGAAIPLSEDHKPNRRDEEARLKRAGGYVLNIGGVWRATNQRGGLGSYELEGADSRGLYLAVSRAFGDTELKGAARDLICADPEIKVVGVEPDDLFVVLGCDGVWDVLSDQEAVDLAAAEFADPAAAAQAVGKAAFAKGSLDNITVTVVQFSWQSPERAAEVVSARRRRLKAEREAAEQADEDLDMFA
jgi:serine/threonine protein phosphatase PrpC